MKFFDYIRYGLKNMWRQKARSLLTIFAIMIGSISVVLMLTIVLGAKQAAIHEIESAGALTQVTVSGDAAMSSDDIFSGGSGGRVGNLKLDDALLAKVQAIPHVSSAYAELQAWPLSNGTTDASGKKINLNQVTAYQPGPSTDKQLVAGRNLTKDDVYSILIGQNTLEALGYKGNPQAVLGKTLDFKVPGYVGDDKNVPLPPDQSGFGGPDNSYWQNVQNHIDTLSVTIVGVTAAGLFNQTSFVPMSLAIKSMTMNMWQPVQQAQMDCMQFRGPCNPPPTRYEMTSQNQFTQQGYSTFILTVDDLSNVDSVATAVKNMKLGAATAKAVIDKILQLLSLIGWVFGAIGGISLFVAAIGVINTMIMATLERTREIGVMRACGATRAAVRRLFTFEAALLGFWGGLLGTGLAYGLMLGVAHFAGDQLLKQNVPLSVLTIPLWLAAATVAGTTVIGMLAGYAPAIRAARLDPVEALRYE